MNSTSAVTVWNDKSGQSNTMAGTGTWSGGTMVFNGSTNAFSNTLYAFPFGAYSMFAVYSNTTAPAANAYMNAVYGSNGFPMLGTFGPTRDVTARSVVANTGALARAVPVQVGWAARIASTAADQGLGVTTDTSGNVVVTGVYTAAVTIFNQGPSGTAGTTLPPAGLNDGFIAKYSPAGAVVWAARITGTGADIGQRVTTDSSDNVLVTGTYDSAVTIYNQGPSGAAGVTFSVVGGIDLFIAKYSPNGEVLWAARIAGPGTSENVRGIATDPSGNVFVTGHYNGNPLTFYNQGPSGTAGTTLPLIGGFDSFVAKYSPDGAVLWAARIAGTTTSSDIVNGIDTDSSGNVLVTGYYTAAVTFYDQGPSGAANITLSFGGGGATDAFIAKYSSAGAVLWAARIWSGGVDEGNGIATDPSDNVYVTGYYNTTTATFYNQGPSGTAGTTLSAVGANDAFIAKYSSAGAVMWAARIVSTGVGIDTGKAVATDASGNVFVTGNYSAPLTIHNQGPSGTAGATLPFIGGYDIFVAKYSSDGVVLWAARIAGPGASSDAGNAIATDTSGNVIVALHNSGTAVTFYNQGPSGLAGFTLSNAGSDDAFIVKYNPDGFVTIAATPASSNVLVSATYTPSTFSPFVNGFTQNTLAGTTLTTTGLFLGGPSNYFSGTISEVLIYGTTLRDTQRQSVEGYLSRKWGIGNRLITTHPFYTIPPFNRYFNPTDIPGCSLWLDGADNSSMNSTTTVTSWSDKSGLNNSVVGIGTWTGSSMSFDGSNQSFSNTTYVFPISNYSMFSVYSNTTAPAANAYMNAVYGSNGFPMLGTFGPTRDVTARSVVANTGALAVVPVGWAAQIAGTTSSSDQGNAIATDPSGNVLVTGYYSAALTVFNQGPSGTAGTTLSNAGGTDCFVAKYSSAGAVLWAARIASTGADEGTGIATDTSGNVFVIGYYQAALTVYNQGPSGTAGATLPFTGSSDVFIAKYSSAGAVLWAAQITGTTTSDDRGYAIATDPSGNVVMTGYYSAALTVFNQDGSVGTTLPFTAGNDAFVAKYSSAGAVLWAARIGGTGAEIGFGIATDTSGNVLVAGQYTLAAPTFYNQGPSGTAGATLPSASPSSESFVVKYSSAGAVLWAARIGGTGSDQGNAIATDPSGNVLVTGYYTTALTIYNQGSSGTSGATLPITGGTSAQDCFVAKYSSAGAVLWAARIGTTLEDPGFGISTDVSGNVFVTGYYQAGSLAIYNQGFSGTVGTTLPTAVGFDCFVAKYSSAGAVLWGARIGGTGSVDRGRGLATDASGNVVVTGHYSAALTMFNQGGTAGTTLPFTGGRDVFIAKYNPDGFITGPVPASSNVLVSATYTPSTFSPFVNGSNATTLAGTTLATTGIFVGGPSNYFNGTISELLIYSANLTSNQRQQVEGYLIQKWGLSAQTLSNHQYKLIPPAASQPAQFAEVTPGNWTRDWQPELRSLAAANASGVTLTGSNITGGATYTANGWFGGVLGPDGNIYFSPFAATNILRLNVATGVTTNITGGATYTANGWRGGVLGPDGNIYFTPFAATNILRLNVASGVTTNITGGATYTANGWSGGALGPDGNIYFMPFAATNILRLNVATGVTTNITGGATYTASGWGGAILGPDGNIYGTPYNAANILRLNVATGVTTNITGGATYTTSGWQGQTLGQDGNIYFAPTLATNVLRFNVATGVTTNITGGATLSANATRQCVLGPDGNIYFTPHVGSFILQLNVSTGVITSLTPSGITYNGSGGWQGSILGPDGNIYFSPFAASNILKLTFSGLAQLPSSNYCLSAYTNKS
jgi:hypothetical protein